MATNSNRRPGSVEVIDRFENADKTTSKLKTDLDAENARRAADGRPAKSVSRWQVRWVDLDGKQKYKSFRRKIDATQFKNEVGAQLHRGEYIDRDSGRVTIAVLYAEWLPLQVHMKPTTKYNLENNYRNHVKEKWGKREVATIKRPEVSAWVAGMHDQGAGVSTINQALGILRRVLDYAVEAGNLRANPAKGIKTPRSVEKSRAYLTSNRSRNSRRQPRNTPGMCSATTKATQSASTAERP